jgi:hypothetical protein
MLKNLNNDSRRATFASLRRPSTFSCEAKDLSRLSLMLSNSFGRASVASSSHRCKHSCKSRGSPRERAFAISNSEMLDFLRMTLAVVLASLINLPRCFSNPPLSSSHAPVMFFFRGRVEGVAEFISLVVFAGFLSRGKGRKVLFAVFVSRVLFCGVCLSRGQKQETNTKKKTKQQTSFANVLVAVTRARLTLRAPPIPMIREAYDDWSNSGLGVCFIFWAGPPGAAQNTTQTPTHFAYVIAAGTRAHLTLRAPGHPLYV